jgi:hypothetical protein
LPGFTFRLCLKSISWSIPEFAISASRMQPRHAMKREDVRAARAWYYAVLGGDLTAGEPMPMWPSKVLERTERAR